MHLSTFPIQIEQPDPRPVTTKEFEWGRSETTSILLQRRHSSPKEIVTTFYRVNSGRYTPNRWSLVNLEPIANLTLATAVSLTPYSWDYQASILLPISPQRTPDSQAEQKKSVRRAVSSSLNTGWRRDVDKTIPYRTRLQSTSNVYHPLQFRLASRHFCHHRIEWRMPGRRTWSTNLEKACHSHKSRCTKHFQLHTCLCHRSLGE